MSWSQQIVSTDRGTFEIFVSGAGDPICISHLYEEYNEKGDAFAEHFTKYRTVYLINLKNAGNSDKAKTKSELTIHETIKDLESIRIALGHESNHFAYIEEAEAYQREIGFFFDNIDNGSKSCLEIEKS